MDEDARKPDRHFLIGIFLLIAAAAVVPFSATWQTILSLIALVYLVPALINQAPPPTLPAVSWVTKNIDGSATTTTGDSVAFEAVISVPSNAQADDIRFAIPQALRQSVIDFLTELKFTPNKLDLEEHLVRSARKLSDHLKIPRMDASVTAFQITQARPRPGITIGYKK